MFEKIPLDVDMVVFAPIASAASIALNRERKDAGALVIDMGGGTTDYALYLNGADCCLRCIPVGRSYHHDIHLVTKIPLSKAEKIKRLEGDASGDPAKSVGSVTIPDDKGFPEHTIERSLLNDIIRYRLEETMNLVVDASARRVT